ncbi:MAG: alpha-L-fucosidase, partial [Phycisphaerales bacterium]|nr:alpha-L-fucosidase [Phycisphaerales bacterium]
TDQLLLATDADAKKHLSELMFQYGRYLMIACSRPGDQPANLQGIWNEEMRAPWSGNFTININTQMNYWPAEPANLAECHRPLLDFIGELAVTGRQIAKTNYGCEGWCAHHNADLWRNAAPVGDWGAPPADPVWAIWPMGGVWLCQHLWEHYAFGGDLNYLRQAYPTMKGACAFILDFLVEGPDGTLTTSPSTSPEHNFITPDGGRRALSVGSTCDLALIHDLLTNTIEASKALDIDADFCARLRQTLDRLAKQRILPDGRLAEWSHDFPEADAHHRHVSHLLGVHPGRQWTGTSEEGRSMMAAARKSLEMRGNASTGWSLAWKINLWARLGDGEQALDCIRILLTPVTDRSEQWQGGVYLNLFDAHPPFQIDGNFGFTSGVCEMLLQSHAGELHLLPALPKAWPDGRVRGLRARGGVTVDLIWQGGALVRAELLSERSQQVAVRVGDQTRSTELLAGERVILTP